MSGPRRIAAVAVALLVVAAGVVLRVESARREATGAASSCGVVAKWASLPESVDCDAVQDSPYAKVGGVSLSTLGAAAHAVLALWLLLAAAGGTLLVAAGALAALNVLAAAGTAYLAWFVVGKVCLYCMVMQAGILALAVLVVPPAWRALRQGPARGDGWKGALAAATVVAVFLAGDAYAARRAGLVKLYQAPPGKAVRLDVSDCIVVGDPATDLSVLIFFDFGCRYCKATVREVMREVRTHPESVHLVLKHYPLEKHCNPHLDATVHPASCEAAVAGQAAVALGPPEPVIEWLFEKQEKGYGFGALVLKQLGPRVGVEDPAEWQRRMDAPEVHDLVQRDIAEGNALQLRAVPSVYINGRAVQHDQAALRVRKLLEAK